MLYHINTKTGEPGKCSASKGKCPFGGDAEHYTSQDAARSAFESSQESFSLATKTKDLSTLLPEWHGKLPANIERKIAEKIAKDDEFLAAIDSGAIETKYAHIEQFLSPPIYAIRGRSTYFTKDDEIDIDLAPEEYLIAIHSRQGGGNRECWCDDYDSHEPGCLSVNNDEMESHPQYCYDEDDMYDSTYATHYFRGNFSEEDIERNREQDKLLNRARSIKDYRRRIADGAPPWGVLTPDNSSSNSYALNKQQVEYKKRNLGDALVNEAFAVKGIDAIKNDVNISDADAIEIAKRAGYSRWDQKRFSEQLKNYHRIKNNRVTSEKIHAEAEDLPDGDLKTYLIGDRGTGYYNTTEKRGRSKVQVKKSYSRGSLLGKELEDAKRSEASAFSTLKGALGKLNEVKKSSAQTSQEYKAAQTDLEKSRASAWKAGWPGLVKDLPPIPEKF